ncbi:MAG: hydrolase, partial [Oscillospiraceae bacterium]|nr:hydrolase [Oscillospiraceae bacterium]
MIYYTADLHFGHDNVIKFDNRPFSSVEEMDRTIIEHWNGRVTYNDDVYIVGDFAFKNERPFTWYLDRLKGKKHLIVGNHDRDLLNDEAAMRCFESVDK